MKLKFSILASLISCNSFAIGGGYLMEDSVTQELPFSAVKVIRDNKEVKLDSPELAICDKVIYQPNKKYDSVSITYGGQQVILDKNFPETLVDCEDKSLLSTVVNLVKGNESENIHSQAAFVRGDDKLSLDPKILSSMSIEELEKRANDAWAIKNTEAQLAYSLEMMRKIAIKENISREDANQFIGIIKEIINFKFNYLEVRHWLDIVMRKTVSSQNLEELSYIVEFNLLAAELIYQEAHGKAFSNEKFDDELYNSIDKQENTIKSVIELLEKIKGEDINNMGLNEDIARNYLMYAKLLPYSTIEPDSIINKELVKYSKYLSKEEDNIELDFLRSISLLNTGQFELAIKQINKFVERSEEFREMLNNREGSDIWDRIYPDKYREIIVDFHSAMKKYNKSYADNIEYIMLLKKLHSYSKSRSLFDDINTKLAYKFLSQKEIEQLDVAIKDFNEAQSKLRRNFYYPNVDKENLFKDLKEKSEKKQKLINDLKLMNKEYSEITKFINHTEGFLNSSGNDVLVDFSCHSKSGLCVIITSMQNGSEVQIQQLDTVLKAAEMYETVIQGHNIDGFTLKDFDQFFYQSMMYDIMLSITRLEKVSGKKFRNIIISPDSTLSKLPFELLPIKYNEDGEIKERLGEIFNVSYSPSLAIYNMQKEREKDVIAHQKENHFLAFGDARYNQHWPNNPQECGDNRSLGIQRSNKTGVWCNLPGTRKEIEQVSSLFKETATIFSASEATEENLSHLNKLNKLKDYRYILLSGHGNSGRSALYSSVVFDQIAKTPKYDGYLTAEEASKLKLNTQLVILSACDTAAGKVENGVGIVGLPYAFTLAGSQGTLVTLWPVDDNATAEFMKIFFTKLKDGMPNAVALSETKREFKKHPKWSEQKYWAPFILYGI